MKILVVEDEVQLADTLAEILKRNKYRFFCKCWGRRKQRSFGKNQMRTAF